MSRKTYTFKNDETDETLLVVAQAAGESAIAALYRTLKARGGAVVPVWSLVRSNGLQLKGLRK